MNKTIILTLMLYIYVVNILSWKKMIIRKSLWWVFLHIVKLFQNMNENAYIREVGIFEYCSESIYISAQSAIIQILSSGRY